MGTETHSEGTVGVPGLDLGGSPETTAGGPDMLGLRSDTAPGNWGFWVGASGSLARRPCGAEAG